MSSFTVARCKNGFTLVEIMIVVLIIAILMAIAIPNFLRARTSAASRSCQANLREIETAKEQWAMDNRKSDGDTPETSDLDPYIKNGWSALSCEASGTYTVNAIGTDASCSIGGTPGSYSYHGL